MLACMNILEIVKVQSTKKSRVPSLGNYNMKCIGNRMTNKNYSKINSGKKYSSKKYSRKYNADYSETYNAFGRQLRLPIAVLLVFVMVASIVMGSSFSSKAANYDAEYRINRTLKVSGGSSYNIRTIHQYYDENEYVSLRDMANALNGTEAQFSVTITKSGITFKNNAPYSPVGGENSYFEGKTRAQSEPEYNRVRNSFTVNGYNHHYYTFIYETSKGVYDCYMYLTDLVLLLEKKVWTENNVLGIDPSTKLELDLARLESEDFFSGTNAVLIGDATTGEVYYSYNGDSPAAMASTTKLMTYLVVMDAVSAGQISLDDRVVFSENVNRLSYAVDGTIRMATGASATVSDLIGGMLLPSSNECALALAEHVGGTEDNFVAKMNSTAARIGLSDATRFYNSNGLPTYTDTAFESKIQNRISVNDMFKLASHILAAYPQITEITSKTSLTLSTLDRTVYNTNPMLFNMMGAVGLKTGTTNKAGCCLVSAVQVEGSNGKHTLVAVELGAEDVVTRNYISKTLLMYGKQVFANGGVSSIVGYEPEKYKIEGNIGIIRDEVPDDAESLAELIVWTARNYVAGPVPEDIEVPADAPGF